MSGQRVQRQQLTRKVEHEVCVLHDHGGGAVVVVQELGKGKVVGGDGSFAKSFHGAKRGRKTMGKMKLMLKRTRDLVKN